MREDTIECTEKRSLFESPMHPTFCKQQNLVGDKEQPFNPHHPLKVFSVQILNCFVLSNIIKEKMYKKLSKSCIALLILNWNLHFYELYSQAFLK